MARTNILPTDPAAVKIFSGFVEVDAKKKSFWDKMTGGEDSALPVVQKTDLESGPGDEVTTTMIAKLRGQPIQGNEKGEGREDRLSHYTHKMRIDKHRKLVNCGDIMAQKRVRHDIVKQVRARLSDYFAEIYDEQCHMTACGARGVSDEILHYPLGFAGFPNAFRAPDAGHLMVASGKTKATLLATDTLTLKMVDRAKIRAKKMFGVELKGNRMEPVTVDGEKSYVLLGSPESMVDLRAETGEAAWITFEKAKAAAVGAKSPIFTAADSMYQGVLLMEHETCVKFDDYGAGANVKAVRNLFLGAHAIAVSHGTKGQRGGVRFQLENSSLDHGEEDVVVTRMIAGFDKTVYNGMDFGVQALDTAFNEVL